MTKESMGRMIARVRASRQMTEDELAAKVGVQAGTVENWERGACQPDASLWRPLAAALDVTVTELLRCEAERGGGKTALTYRAKPVGRLCAALFSLLLLVGAVVCAICDVALSGRFTWSLFPISSIVFAWLVLLPVVRFGGKGSWGTLTALSVFIFPYLWVLDGLVPVTDLILPIGIRAAVLSLLFLWTVVALFHRWKERKLLVSAAALLLLIPVYGLLNVSLAGILSQPLVDVWDLMSVGIIAAAAASLFAADSIIRGRPSSPSG